MGSPESGHHESRHSPAGLLCPHRIWTLLSNCQQRQLVAPYPDSPYPVQLEERQDQIAERQSVAITSITTVAVVAVISFTVSVITNIVFSINATFPEPEKPEWEWCYDDPSCDEEAWRSQAEVDHIFKSDNLRS